MFKQFLSNLALFVNEWMKKLSRLLSWKNDQKREMSFMNWLGFGVKKKSSPKCWQLPTKKNSCQNVYVGNVLKGETILICLIFFGTHAYFEKKEASFEFFKK